MSLAASSMADFPVFHLSTSMCPGHPLDKLEVIISLLKDNKPLILVSTQLIEAGMDVDFDVVIRSFSFSHFLISQYFTFFRLPF